MPVILAAAAVLLLLLAGVLYENKAGKDAYDHFRPPGKHVAVGGRLQYYLATGERQPGQPLVVQLAGHGDWSRCWVEVQPEIARFARVLSYDRAGSGWSEPGPPPRKAERLVRELHDLLETLGEAPPYLLVGHSLGGPLARLFARLYPAEVVGMVWVDSAHEHMERFLPFYNKALSGLLFTWQAGRLLSRLGLMRLAGRRMILSGYASVQDPAAQAELLAQTSGPRFFDWMLAETRDLSRAGNWPEANASLGDLPVISIEAQYTPDPPPKYPPRQWREFLAGWKALHEDLSRLSSRLQRIPVQTGHQVMHEAPAVVINAVKEVFQNDLG